MFLDVCFDRGLEGAGVHLLHDDVSQSFLPEGIQEVEAAQLARVLPDVNLAAINGNYALEAGLKVSDAIATESSESDAAKAYANVLVVKEGREKDEAILKLVEVLKSSEVRQFIEEKYEGGVVPVD